MLNLQHKHEQDWWGVRFNSMCFVDLSVTCSAINHSNLAFCVKVKLDMVFAGSHSDLVWNCSLGLRSPVSFFSLSHLNKHMHWTLKPTSFGHCHTLDRETCFRTISSVQKSGIRACRIAKVLKAMR